MADYKYRYRDEYKGIKIDIKANTAKQLNEKIKAKKAKIDRISFGSDALLYDFGIQYIETYKAPKVSEEWVSALKAILKNHIVAGIGNRKISSIRTIEVQKMLNNLNASSGFTGKVFNLTCQIFHHAYINGIVEADISTLIVRPSGRKPQKGVSLTPREQEAFLKVVDGCRGTINLLLMYYCGLRPKETLQLQWRDVDLKNKSIHIRGTKTANADRIVPIPDVFFPVLKASKGSGFDSVGLTKKSELDWAWHATKRAMNIDMGCKVYRNELIPPYPLQEPLRLYDLRHTYCTNLELAGVPLSIASRLMGHSDISLTAAIYTHGTTEAVEQARNLINGKNENFSHDFSHDFSHRMG